MYAKKFACQIDTILYNFSSCQVLFQALSGNWFWGRDRQIDTILYNFWHEKALFSTVSGNRKTGRTCQALERKQTTSTWLDCSRLMSDFSVRSREFIKACFCRKTHRLLPLYVLGNRSKTLLLLIICKRTDSPTASRLRSEGTSLKSHRLNINSSRDRICTFFRFRMDMDHYVLSSLASLLFPEP